MGIGDILCEYIYGSFLLVKAALEVAQKTAKALLKALDTLFNTLMSIVRYVIDVRDNRNMKTYMDEFYKSHDKLEGDKFIPCNSCPEMVAVISSMGKEKTDV